MNGIGLSTPVFDLNGSRYFRGCELDPGVTQKNDQRARRTSRTATLDGGVSVYDTGYAVGDRDINLTVPDASATVSAFLAYLVEFYGEIIVTTEVGAFLGVPVSYSKDDNGRASLIIGITKKA